MKAAVHGLHHVTAISGDAQENLDFYNGVLGMRLVKRSVNQDAPDTYHLFYADGAGTPGTDLTFFPWPGAAPGRPGTGQAVEVSLAVPAASLGWWAERLAAQGVEFAAPETRFGEPTLAFADPHGLPVALVATDDPRPFAPWAAGPVPVDQQVRGLHAVRLWQRDLALSAHVLTFVLGFQLQGEEDGWYRFAAGAGGSGTLVELRELPDARLGTWGPGAIHHVAWRVADDAEELAVRAAVEAAGLRPTGQIDRFWFTSVYFREPGGALFELATDGPGFDRDEDPAHLGEALILPPWLEPHRAAIETALPPLSLPALVGTAGSGTA